METWKDIKGYEGIYQVSDCGRVKSFPRNGTRINTEKILHQSFTADGYKRVRLLHGEKDRTRTVHRLVAEHFIPNDNPKLTVNHKDGDKTNNRVENLEWVDRSEQMLHAYKLGLKQSAKGTKNTQAKLTKEQVEYIRRVYKRQSTEFGTVALAKKFGVSNRVIGLICRGLSYKDV